MKLLDSLRKIWNGPMPDVSPAVVNLTSGIPIAIALFAGAKLQRGEWFSCGLYVLVATICFCVWRYFCERNAERRL